MQAALAASSVRPRLRLRILSPAEQTLRSIQPSETTRGGSGLEAHQAVTRGARSALRCLAIAISKGDDRAARRQVQLYRQAEAPSRTRRGRLRGSRPRQARGRAAHLEKPAAATKAAPAAASPTPPRPRNAADWRTARRQGICKPSGRGTIALREESRGDTQANRDEVGRTQEITCREIRFHLPVRCSRLPSAPAACATAQ